MTKLYQSTIKHVGELAEEALADNMMILFGEMAPQMPLSTVLSTLTIA